MARIWVIAAFTERYSVSWKSLPSSLDGFWVVYDLLGRVDPQQVHRPERIDHVLERWGGLKIGGYKDGEEMEGNFTFLPLKQELRCFIAALYGSGFVRGFVGEKSVYEGNVIREAICSEEQ